MKPILLSLLVIVLFVLNACAGNSSNMHHDHSKMSSDAMPDEGSHAAQGHAGHDMTQHGEMMFTSREHAVTQLSPSSKYKLSLFCNDPAIPLHKIHSWTLHVEDANGKPADNLKIFVSGGMPMHRHAFPTKPRVSDHLGNGDYRVEGIKFNMAGHWEMRFNLNEKGKPMGRDLEQIVFQIHRK